MYFTKTYPFLTSGRPCHFELNLYESFPLGLKEKKMIFFLCSPRRLMPINSVIIQLVGEAQRNVPEQHQSLEGSYILPTLILCKT